MGEIKTMRMTDVIRSALFTPEGEFNRYDMVIRIKGVRDWHYKREYNPLWWRMQYAKLWYQVGSKGVSYDELIEAVPLQRLRMTSIVDTYISGGMKTFPPISLAANMSLADGAHRLSTFLFFGRKKIKVEHTENDGYFYYYGTQLRSLKLLYSNSEWKEIEAEKELFIERLEAGKWGTWIGTK